MWFDSVFELPLFSLLPSLSLARSICLLWTILRCSHISKHAEDCWCLCLHPSFCPFFMHLKFEYPFNKTFGWGDWDPKLHKILAKCHIACKHECYKQENKKIYVASWTFVDFVVLHTCSNANPLRSVNLTNIHIPKTPKCYFMYNMIMHFTKLLFMSPKEDA